MPLEDYDGYTFVAYLDISGFKLLMKKETGWKALDLLYSSGYRNLQRHPVVQGFFVSDCGILFVKDNPLNGGLSTLLTVIKEINKDLAMQDFMLTSSIAYGAFKYKSKIEFTGIEKNPIYGNAYLSSVIDTEETTPKIEPTQCRVVKKNLPFTLDELRVNEQNNPEVALLREKAYDRKHYYYYWMVNKPFEIEPFEKMFADSYQMKYAGMLKAAKEFAFNH